ncbi:hypothetical protein BJ322DRAFT_1040828 [Thelephora terrestris]|uniref:Uncharacterized protein n=1 Tax=Thelephora terrestris TaxID=56493 RepID=A0A9P6HQ48_9AGAM|nr:hypothetical protein BJ322DRAFT_1040828 [Thelephora terrestris]
MRSPIVPQLSYIPGYCFVCTPDTYWNQRVLRTENTVPWIHKPHRKIPMSHSVFSGRPRPASGEFESAPASTADFKRRRRSLAWRADKSSCRSDVSCETMYRAGLIDVMCIDVCTAEAENLEVALGHAMKGSYTAERVSGGGMLICHDMRLMKGRCTGVKTGMRREPFPERLAHLVVAPTATKLDYVTLNQRLWLEVKVVSRSTRRELSSSRASRGVGRRYSSLCYVGERPSMKLTGRASRPNVHDLSPRKRART